MSTSVRRFVASLAVPVVAGLLAISSSPSLAFTLPTANCLLSNQNPAINPTANCLTFTDFNVFSLPLLDIQALGPGADGKLGPGEANYVTSTYGQIQNYTIVGINNGNSTSTGNPPTTMDGSYNTPSQNNEPAFSTYHGINATDPAGGPPVGDRTTTWDALIGSASTANTLLDISNGTPLVFFFAFNETGTTNGLASTDMLVWAKVSVFNYCDGSANDSAGCVAGAILDRLDFYMQYNGDGNKYDDASTPNPQTLVSGNPTGAGLNQTNVGPYAYVHAGICVIPPGTFVGFPNSSGACPVGSLTYSQVNIGQNAAAFAVNSPGLDLALASGDFDTMSISWNMAYANGGGETLWVQPSGLAPCRVDCFDVPEPDSLPLVGLGLIGLGWTIRRQRNSRQAS